MPPGRPRSRLAPEVCTARLDVLRHPGESWADLATRLHITKQRLRSARVDGVSEALLSRWEVVAHAFADLIRHDICHGYTVRVDGCEWKAYRVGALLTRGSARTHDGARAAAAMAIRDYAQQRISEFTAVMQHAEHAMSAAMDGTVWERQ